MACFSTKIAIIVDVRAREMVFIEDAKKMPSVGERTDGEIDVNISTARLIKRGYHADRKKKQQLSGTHTRGRGR